MIDFDGYRPKCRHLSFVIAKGRCFGLNDTGRIRGNSRKVGLTIMKVLNKPCIVNYMKRLVCNPKDVKVLYASKTLVAL